MDEDFIRAAKSGEIKKIKECLAAGVNVNITNPVRIIKIYEHNTGIEFGW